MDPKKTFEEILDIIHFDGDREFFIETFFEECQKKATSLESLAKITEEALRAYIKSVAPKLTDEEKTNLREYFASKK